MRLAYAQIKNFRSVEDARIHFDPSCRILVGINESGKSNILRALSMLVKDVAPSKSDIRQTLPDEPPITEAHVRFVFRLDNDELESIYQAAAEKIFTEDAETPILAKSQRILTLRDFVFSKNEGLLVVNLLKVEKSVSHWSISNEYRMASNWKKPSAKCPTDFTFTRDGERVVHPKELKMIVLRNYDDIPSEYLEDVTTVDVNSLVGGEIVEMVGEEVPESLFWVYDEKNLLPSQLKLDEFAANPEICIPLKNMFQLAGYTEIQKSILEAKETSAHGLRNLLDRVAKRTTDHFQSVWKEYKSIQFELIPNGPYIDASVKEEFNHYGFAQRSDGFKRFVSFLLLVSTKVKTNQLQNALLIIDEPDTSLHPSGCRFLRDELIRISNKNLVIYSTHSIFMIHGRDLGRHIIITKENEKTQLTVATESNVFDEEVLCNALGYSIFESLREKNLLFEGWRDKHLFQVALQRLPADYSRLRQVLKRVGVCHSKGVSHIRSITPILEMCNRQVLILSDGDEAARESQRQYVRAGGYGTWKRYDEIVTSADVITSEDFIKGKVFKPFIEEIMSQHRGLPELSEEELNHPRGKLSAIARWLENGGIAEDDKKAAIDSVKKHVFESLKPTDIERIYYDYLQGIVAIL